MHSDRDRRARTVAHEDETAARVRRHSDNALDPDFILGKLVLAPGEAFVGAEKDVVRGLLVVCHDKDRSRVAKFPQMSIFVDLFPCEPCVTAQEGVALRIRLQRLANVSDRHEQSHD